ncbi:DUF6448 family protein [Agromyces bauzanensis]
MTMLLIAGLAAAAVVLALAVPRPARAHCDTMDGPTVADGRRALETGNVNHARKWVDEHHEAELIRAFELAARVRGLGEDARELADQYFLETLVRLHRAGEGEPYEGIKPSGTPIEDAVAAADRCVATGSMAPLEGMFTEEELAELRERFDRVLATKEFDVDDVAAGRAFIAAYVGFFHFAEGEVHGHEGHGHEHGHHEHEHHGEHHH